MTEGKLDRKTRQNMKQQDLEGRKQVGKNNGEDKMEEAGRSGLFPQRMQAEGVAPPLPGELQAVNGCWVGSQKPRSCSHW